ncbi:MAG: Ig-like domain-containing protein [Patescibacteria group bacterium]
MPGHHISWYKPAGLVILFILLGWLLYGNLEPHANTATGPQVTAVYPTSDVLPANLLRLYVQFSEPMKTVGNLERIQLLDQSGTEVPHVFFNNVQELWNHEQTQLTLIVDPARVKTGLVAHETLGRALVPGKTYTLVVAGLENTFHQPMPEMYEKAFTVTDADLNTPDLSRWELSAVAVGSKAALEVTFPEPLDYLSLQQRLTVTTAEDVVVPGTIMITNQETIWRFTPAASWEAGEYRLQVNTRLEDPAGNNLNGLFDHTADGLHYDREGVTEFIPFTSI